MGLLLLLLFEKYLTFAESHDFWENGSRKRALFLDNLVCEKMKKKGLEKFLWKISWVFLLWKDVESKVPWFLWWKEVVFKSIFMERLVKKRRRKYSWVLFLKKVWVIKIPWFFYEKENLFYKPFSFKRLYIFRKKFQCGKSKHFFKEIFFVKKLVNWI